MKKTSDEQGYLTPPEKIHAKAKITRLVGMYIKYFPEEWKAFKSMMAWRRENNTRGGQIKGMELDYVERQIHQIPETLYGAFMRHLERSEIDWFLRTKEGSRWFAKEFKDFASTDKI